MILTPSTSVSLRYAVIESCALHLESSTTSSSIRPTNPAGGIDLINRHLFGLQRHGTIGFPGAGERLHHADAKWGERLRGGLGGGRDDGGDRGPVPVAAAGNRRCRPAIATARPAKVRLSAKAFKRFLNFRTWTLSHTAHRARGPCQPVC